MALFTKESNAEVNELNKAIALLSDRIKTSEVLIDQLGPLDTSINLKEICTSDNSTQTKNANQNFYNSNVNSGQSVMSGNVNVNDFDKVVVQVSNSMTHSTAHNQDEVGSGKPIITQVLPASKHLIACPFLWKKELCLKGSKCDFSHNVSQTRINKNTNVHSVKHSTPCPFLLSKGHCLKGSRCDFLPNISQSRIGNKANVNSPEEVIEINNDAVYPTTTLKDNNVSTSSSGPNEVYEIPVRITTRRRGKRNPQKSRRRSEHFCGKWGITF